MASTSALQCRICGAWVSTDAPRTFGRSTDIAANVVAEKMAVHMHTYHQDYLDWNRPYFLGGLALILFGAVTTLLGAYFMNTLILFSGISATLILGIPTLLIYRRRFADYKESWNHEHPLGLASVRPGDPGPFYQCFICRKQIQIEKGLRYDRQAHYAAVHPDYLRLLARERIASLPILIAGIIIIFLFAELVPGLTLLPIIGTISVAAVLAFYASTRERRLRKLWQTEHEKSNGIISN